MDLLNAHMPETLSRRLGETVSMGVKDPDEMSRNGRQDREQERHRTVLSESLWR